MNSNKYGNGKKKSMDKNDPILDSGISPADNFSFVSEAV